MLWTPASNITRRSMPTPRPAVRRHPVLQGTEVVLVDAAAFEVAGVLGRLFVLEAVALLDRVVELAVSIGVLTAVDEQLEAIRNVRVGRVDLASGDTSTGWPMTNVGRTMPSSHSFSNNSSISLPDPHDGSHRTPCVSAMARTVSTGSWGARLPIRRPTRRRTCVPRPRLGEVDLRAGDVDHRRADSVTGGVDDERLGELDDVGDVAERLIRLHHRELGIVRRVHPLVAEGPSDLEDPVQAADDQPLEVEFGGDAQVQRDVERVVVGHERTGVGAAGLDVERRRLDLDESSIGQVVRKLVSTAWRISKTRRAVALTTRSA